MRCYNCDLMRTQLSVAATLAILLTACSPGASPASPTTVNLSGRVLESTESGSAPVQGALVDGGSAAQSARTDAGGFFSITGLPAIRRDVVTSKFGYGTDTRTVTLAGDVRLEITLTRLPTYTLSGVAFEITPTGQAPIEGVEVYCAACGPSGDVFSLTDSSGRYLLSEVVPGLHALLVSKAGFALVDPTRRIVDYDEKDVTVEGDTRFDIQLVRR